MKKSDMQGSGSGSGSDSEKGEGDDEGESSKKQSDNAVTSISFAQPIVSYESANKESGKSVNSDESLPHKRMRRHSIAY